MNTQKITSNKQQTYPLSLTYTRQQQQNIQRTVIRRANPDKVALPTLDGLVFEKVRNIIYLEAQGNYTYIHMAGNKKFLVCKTLRQVEEGIRTDSFVRVHRSYTINMLLLTRYIKGKGGYVIMEDGSTVNVSAGRKKAFMEAVEILF